VGSVRGSHRVNWAQPKVKWRTPPSRLLHLSRSLNHHSSPPFFCPILASEEAHLTRTLLYRLLTKPPRNLRSFTAHGAPSPLSISPDLTSLPSFTSSGKDPSTMTTQPRSVHDALLFECAWEVANKGESKLFFERS